MEKNLISRGTHAGVPSTVNQPLTWVRISLLASFLAFGLASLQPMASARAADQTPLANEAATTSRHPRASVQHDPPCEQLLVECLANGGGTLCIIEFEACQGGGL